MQDDNNKKRDEIAQLLRDSIIPKKRPQTITIEKVVIVVPGSTAVEFLTALREALKDPQ